MPEKIEVPAMRIVFQQPISPLEGHGISFELAEDVMIGEPELNELLDRVTNAARRLSYIEELPRSRHLLAAKQQELRKQDQERERAHARVASFVTLASTNRRKEAPVPEGDKTAIIQFDQRIAALRLEIGLLERRIPYLEAYIAGDRDAVEPVMGFAEAAE